MQYAVKYVWEHDGRREIVTLEFETKLQALEMIEVLDKDKEVIKVSLIDIGNGY